MSAHISRVHVVANFVLFQLGWLACVLGGASERPWLGPLFVVLFVAWHLHVALRPHRELVLLAVAAGIGASWDSLLVALGWVRYPSGVLVAGTAPYWIVAMWILFAATLNVSLRWFHRKYYLATIAGAVAGPLAYYAGHRLGGVAFADTATAMFALSGGWAVMMPVLVALAERLDGFDPGETAAKPTLITEVAN